MEMRLLWTEKALTQLEQIFNYYKVQASPEIAKKLIVSLIREATILETSPLIGMKEPLLAERAFEYWYIVKKSYKIIYRVDRNLIKIITVFDCRQNPEKLKGLVE